LFVCFFFPFLLLSSPIHHTSWTVGFTIHFFSRFFLRLPPLPTPQVPRLLDPTGDSGLQLWGYLLYLLRSPPQSLDNVRSPFVVSCLTIWVANSQLFLLIPLRLVSPNRSVSTVLGRVQSGQSLGASNDPLRRLRCPNELRLSGKDVPFSLPKRLKPTRFSEPPSPKTTK